MRKTVFAFPDEINEFVVDDTLFARAYQEVSAQKRALLKTCIARLYDWYGPSRDKRSQVMTSWRGGFDSIRCSAPVDFAVVLLDRSMRSPSRLLAGLVPALACGVEHVLTVRVGADSPWEVPQLVGLELAGQELVADMDMGQLDGLLAKLRISGHHGVVVDLTADANPCAVADSMNCYRPGLGSEVVVWTEAKHSFDFEALVFSQPDAVFTVFGPDVSFPGGNFQRGSQDTQDFLDTVSDVAFVPSSLMEDALNIAKLVLGPGQEGCWVWPDLHPALFQIHRIAWTIGA